MSAASQRLAPSGRRSPGLRRTAAGVAMVLFTLACASLILGSEPTIRQQLVPFVHTGAIGDTVDARTFSAQVLGVRGARYMATSAAFLANPAATGRTDTAGVFVIVKVRITGYAEPVRVGYIGAVDGDGIRYTPATRIHQSSPVRFEAGIPVQFEVVFEVQRKSTTSLTIQFAAGTTGFDDRLQTFAAVPLGITANQVAGWLADPNPARADSAEVIG